MPDYIKVTIGNETSYLERRGNDWTKQLAAPVLTGDYKLLLEIGKSDGEVITFEPLSSLTVRGKFFDLGQYGKLNETLIKRIILTISGCASHVFFDDSIVRVIICMDDYNETAVRAIEQVLLLKIPAHLKLEMVVDDNAPKHMGAWRDIPADFETWDDVCSAFADLNEVKYYRSNDCATCNEVRTGFRTWADVKNHFATWDDLISYRPVEPLAKEVDDYVLEN